VRAAAPAHGRHRSHAGHDPRGRPRPVVDEQLADVDLLLDALLAGEADAVRDKSSPPVHGPLDALRADYLARLCERCRSLDEQVLDLAKACTHLFAPALGCA
jgi:hypothetical protein